MELMYTGSYHVEKADYSSAGRVSAAIKRQLKQIGVSGDVLRRVAVASYEVELNLVIHSLGGEMTLNVFPDCVQLISADVGPGIPDLSLAMKEGYSTANETARSLGFGAGMGLPTMKRNADDFDIESTVGVGTTITMGFHLT